jgi:hypothetical protein
MSAPAKLRSVSIYANRLWFDLQFPIALIITFI